MDLNAIFYIGKYNQSDDSWSWVDIEHNTVFNDNDAKTRYRFFKGLDSKGKPKNVYSESYAESDVERFSVPETVARETTDITLDIVFLEKDGCTSENYYNYRQQHFDAFYNHIKDGVFVYWDNIRKRAAICVLEDAVSVEEERYVSSKPYLEIEFKLKNIYGECVHCETRNDVETFAKQIIINSLT